MTSRANARGRLSQNAPIQFQDVPWPFAEIIWLLCDCHVIKSWRLLTMTLGLVNYELKLSWKLSWNFSKIGNRVAEPWQTLNGPLKFWDFQNLSISISTIYISLKPILPNFQFFVFICIARSWRPHGEPSASNSLRPLPKFQRIYWKLSTRIWLGHLSAFEDL